MAVSCGFLGFIKESINCSCCLFIKRRIDDFRQKRHRKGSFRGPLRAPPAGPPLPGGSRCPGPCPCLGTGRARFLSRKIQNLWRICPTRLLFCCFFVVSPGWANPSFCLVRVVGWRGLPGCSSGLGAVSWLVCAPRPVRPSAPRRGAPNRLGAAAFVLIAVLTERIFVLTIVL